MEEGERKTERNGLTEWETEHWRDLETAWARKWPLEKDTWVFQINQLNRTNTASIKWDINNLERFSNSLFNCAVTFVCLTMHLTTSFITFGPDLRQSHWLPRGWSGWKQLSGPGWSPTGARLIKPVLIVSDSPDRKKLDCLTKEY